VRCIEDGHAVPSISGGHVIPLEGSDIKVYKGGGWKGTPLLVVFNIKSQQLEAKQKI
jgi:hypothetical protein